MKAAIVAGIIAAVSLVPFASGGSNPNNWQEQVQRDCHRLVVVAKWTVIDGRDGSVHQRRLGRLQAKQRACSFALGGMPG
jgi:hypothetical protein